MIRRTIITFRNILQIRDPLSGVESKKSEILWRIPPEVVEIIFQFLPDLDQACFALSCKRLHASYVSYTRQRGVCVLSTLPRAELLRRLQNKRWIYCSGCQNLHRYSQWQLLQFRKKCGQKPSIFDCNVWCYIQHAGEVDICPCSSITFHQKQHPIDYFQSQQKALRCSAYSTSFGSFAHLCAFKHPLAQVLVKTRARFNKASKTFQVENEFTFQTSKENISLGVFQMISPRQSRYETEFWLKNFLDEAKCEFFIGDESSDWYQCHGWDAMGAGPYSFTILLHRDLGGNRWPSKGWKHNRHN
jgi:hypothetical protein